MSGKTEPGSLALESNCPSAPMVRVGYRWKGLGREIDRPEDWF